MIDGFYQKTLKTKVKEFLELQVQYIVKEINSKKDTWDLNTITEINIKKVDIMCKYTDVDYTN